MTYSAKQIENAKAAYAIFMKGTTARQEMNCAISPREAEERAEYHNNIVKSILSGDKELERKWKIFFCEEEAKKDAKAQASKNKLEANKEASKNVLAPIKELRKIGEFGKWLNEKNNQFRKQHFNKKYTVEAVNAFLATL